MLEWMLFGNTLKNYIVAISIILLFIGIGKLFSEIVVRILKKIAAKTDTLIDDIAIQVLAQPFVFGLFIAGFYYASFYLKFTERGSVIYHNIIEILIVINIVWIVIRIVDSIIEHYLKPLVAKSESKIDDQMLPFARTFVKVIIIIIGAIFLIKNMGYDVTSLVAGLGIGGLAFALAAQPLLSNLFGGLAIIADKPFHVGDRVRIDQKYEGYIQQIGMRSTNIRTPDDTIVAIPNSLIAASVVENLSATQENSIRIILNLGLEYQTTTQKLEEAIKIVQTAINNQEAVIKDNPSLNPIVSFNEFKESSLNIRASYSIIASNKITPTKQAINFEIKKKFEEAGIHFAYPTQTLYLKNN